MNEQLYQYLEDKFNLQQYSTTNKFQSLDSSINVYDCVVVPQGIDAYYIGDIEKEHCVILNIKTIEKAEEILREMKDVYALFV